MEVVKRGYGLFSITLTQQEADSFENACREQRMLSENVLDMLFGKFLVDLFSDFPRDLKNGT